MHELPLAKSIYRSVMKKADECGATAVVRVVIEAGELREYVELILQKYWDYVSRGSLAEGAKIELITLPATVRCGETNLKPELLVEALGKYTDSHIEEYTTERTALLDENLKDLITF